MEIIKTTVTNKITIEGPDITGVITIENNSILISAITIVFNGLKTEINLSGDQMESLCKEFGEVLNFVQTQNKINNEQTNRNVSRDAEIS